MQSKFIFTISLGFIAYFVSCSLPKESGESSISIALNSSKTDAQYLISFVNGKGYNAPSFVLWSEDMEGNYIKTHFITKSYASGIFGHEKVNDSIWKPLPGPSYQPAALPYWTHKKGLINDESLIPTPNNPFIDAYSGATPEQNFEILLPENYDGNFRLLFEVNQTWDWNKFWTNNKYPGNSAYKNSAQPSIIYAVTISKEMNIFYMNPIGHGDPKGESGKLFTNLNTLTTATEIFENIKIERIKK